VVFDVFSVADTVSKADGGTFDGNVSMAGTLVVGESAPDTSISGGTPAFQVIGSAFDSFMSLTRRVASASAPVLALTKSRNTSVGSHTIVQDDDVIGEIVFFADDGTDLDSRVASIKAEVDGTPGANDTPGRLVFMTTADGSNSPTERMRIDSSGNVGIGISSPSFPLEVSGSSFPQVRIHRDFATNSASSATIRFAGDDSAGNVTDYAEIRSLTEVVTNGSEAGALLFGTLSSGSVTERMRIESNGNVIVGASTFGADDSIGLASGGTITSAKASSGGTTHLIFKNGGSQVGGITSNTGATFFNTSSDYRLKENVTYNFDATTRLKQLKPSRFNFIADKDTTVDGFLAHEVASIVPEAISGEKDAVDSDGNIISQAIDQSKIVPLLVKTIQELEARITTLEGA